MKTKNGEHAKVDGGKPQASTLHKNYRQLRNAAWEKIVFSREEDPLVIQCRMISPESIHTSNIMQTEQVVFGDMQTYI